MEQYIGTKTVKAEPMTKGEAYRNGLLRVEALPASENYTKGYHVVYADGYESWSPKDVFESAYKVAETFVDRMHIEYADLEEKAGKLNAFINSDKFKELDTLMKAMLLAQRRSMNEYAYLLACREDAHMGLEGASLCGFSFGVAIGLLENGFVLRRSGWNGKGLVIFKQVPAQIQSDIIPKMQSLPDEAKRLILANAGHIGYTSQCLIYNRESGRGDSWVPSISDVFANDWELVED